MEIYLYLIKLFRIFLEINLQNYLLDYLNIKLFLLIILISINLSLYLPNFIKLTMLQVMLWFDVVIELTNFQMYCHFNGWVNSEKIVGILQRDLNLDCWNNRRAGWPLNNQRAGAQLDPNGAKSQNRLCCF